MLAYSTFLNKDSGFGVRSVVTEVWMLRTATGMLAPIVTLYGHILILV